ncbi:MAG: 3-phosphoserine/phosphohydroxythreonine transaminase, partial [Deltaproteobacteria bacterium]
MTRRIRNFNAGPAALPLEVLEEMQAELLDYRGSGMSIL